MLSALRAVLDMRKRDPVSKEKERATLQTFNEPAHGLIGNGYLKSERVDELQIVHFKTQKAWKLLRKRKL